MDDSVSRRNFLHVGLAAAAAFAGGELILKAEAAPTETSGDLGAYGKYVSQPTAKPTAAKPQDAANWHPTEDNILGPFYRENAPYRAKVTPPLEPGVVVLVSGRVWGFDTKKPLAGAHLDVWQANANGRYDNDDPAKPPAADVFVNRVRLITDEKGFYQYETIHPGAYQIGPNAWRPSHIHYLVQAPGYRTLVTQLYFAGDARNKTDQFIKQSLVVSFAKQKVGGAAIEVGTFDIVLAKHS